MENELTQYKDIQRSLIKTYRSVIWYSFIKALKEYDLLQLNDKVLVNIDFSKQSLVTSMLFCELKRHSDFEFEVEFICDMKYRNYFYLLDYLNINYTAINDCSDIYNMYKNYKFVSYDCYDDQVETTLENMLFNGCFKTILPLDDLNGYTTIRPLYQIRLKDINRWAKFTKICFDEKEISSEKQYCRNLVEKLLTYNENSTKNIYKSVTNVYVHKILGYYKGGKKHSFLDDF